MEFGSDEIRGAEFTFTAEPPLPLPVPAGRIVFNNPYIKLPGLAVIMRCNRAGMLAVAQELYHTVTYDQTQTLLDRCTPRSAMYCDAVSVVNGTAHHMQNHRPAILAQLTSTPSFIARKARGGAEPTDRALAYHLGEYHPDVVDILVRSLTEQHHELKEIRLGGGVTITLSPAPSHGVPADSASSSTSAVIGHIAISRFRYLNVSDGYAQPFLPPAPPSADYTIHERFSLMIQAVPQRSDQSLEDIWQHICSDPHLANAGPIVDCGPLPVRLDDIISSFARPESLGHPKRLGQFYAPYITSYSICDFERFATADLKSLTILDLLDTSCSNLAQISFADLASISRLVRYEMPSLSTLRLTLRMATNPESDCGDLSIEIGHCGLSFTPNCKTACRDALADDYLDQGGLVSSLDITSRRHAIPLFDAIRLCGLMCRPTASIYIRPNEMWPWGSEELQSKLLRYLLHQPAQRRRYLSQVEFSTLDVADPFGVDKLQYHEDGRPIPLRVSESTTWADKAKSLLDHPNPYPSASLSSALHDLDGAASRLKAMAGASTTAEVLEELAKLVEALWKADWAAGQALHPKRSLLKMTGEAEEMRRCLRGVVTGALD